LQQLDDFTWIGMSIIEKIAWTVMRALYWCTA